MLVCNLNQQILYIHFWHVNNKGITLIASIMLIVFASLAVLGVTVFIVQRFAHFEANRVNISGVYLAQAGVQKALYDFRNRDIAANGYFTLGQTNIDSSNFFVLGADDNDCLMVNTASSTTGGSGNRDLVNVTIQNATNSKTVTIDRMLVTWNNSRRLQGIRVNNTTIWSGNSVSPANCNVTNFTLNTTPSIYTVNYLRFSGNMSGSTISILFTMTDGSTKSMTVFPASQNYNLTLKSTGKTTSSNIYRTIKAEYNAITGKIIDYDEINSEITP